MKVVGIDLSGPRNTADTAVAVFSVAGSTLAYRDLLSGATDAIIRDAVSGLAAGDEVTVGLDAPLSYNPGGGERPCDGDLRRRLVAVGMHPGSVMAPTMTRMVYLTLRGIVATPDQSRILRCLLVASYPCRRTE
ncbi:MAG: DUF429 domain-containing protein [Phycisphaerae bacterium]|nr:DUF429 domain-containing protein [Phycisphaerae bacterium]